MKTLLIAMLFISSVAYSQGTYVNMGIGISYARLNYDVGEYKPEFKEVGVVSRPVSFGVSHIFKNDPSKKGQWFTGLDFLIDTRSVSVSSVGLYGGRRFNNLYLYTGAYAYDFNYKNRGFYPRAGVQLETTIYKVLFVYARLEYSKASNLTVGFNLPLF